MRIVLLSSLLCLTACDLKSKEEAEIKTMIMELVTADNRSDLESVVSYYTIDATLMPPGKPSISGRENIRTNYKNIFSTTRLQLETKIEGVEINGFSALAWGFISGKAISLNDSTVSMLDEKYLMHLVKMEGEWKIYRLIWSSNK
jgi:ketosteroid isomerase-like protein